MLGVKMRWKEYGELVKREEAYLAVERCVGGSRPKELFEDLVEEMEEEYEKSKVRGGGAEADFHACPAEGWPE